jgi:hypothetical protein
MPPPDPSSVLYKPTPLEEAYAIYIFEKLFGSFPVTEKFYLDAKTALSVLVPKSGVNGLLLRSMWSVADPDNRKCLTDVSQFHVLLRLIALNQDGLLEQEINNAFNQERGQTTPAAVMKKTLWMSADYDDCPLPSFQGVAIPSVDFLKKFHVKLKGSTTYSSPAPTPAPISVPAPTPSPIPVSKPAPKPQPAQKISRKKDRSRSDKHYQSAIQQLSKLKVTEKNPFKGLDPENFELLQEQAALQTLLFQSSDGPSSRAKKISTPTSSKPKKNQMSEEEALQRAIYESTHDAPSPSKPTSIPSVATAAVTKPKKHENWLRMTSFNDVRKLFLECLSILCQVFVVKFS